MSRRLRSSLAAVVAAVATVAGVVVPLTFGAGPAAAISPALSRSHYIRNLLYTDPAGNVTKMHDLGLADAQAQLTQNSTVTVLHLGAQSITAPLSPAHRGILLSTTSSRLTYLQLSTAIKAYIDAYFGNYPDGSPFLTLAIATNNDGDNYGSYTATKKADDFVKGLITPLRQYVIDKGASGAIGVVGAIDIEAGFASTFSQAQQWETEYLKMTPASLFYTGSADGCPRVGTHARCAVVTDDAGHKKQWTQDNYVALTSSNTRIKVLPQIYVSAQADQWSHIDWSSSAAHPVVGHAGRLRFVGSLTEHAACGACSFAPAAGWNALAAALGNLENKVPGTAATDLDIDGGA